MTTPLPKFKGYKKYADANDYRGITVCTIFSKILEYCILDHVSFLHTSDRQFGFKKGVSCTHSIHMVRKVINYFVKNKSTVNVGVFDLRKAFDKVNIYALLKVLLIRKVNFSIVNMLENWFLKSKSIIKWNNALSNVVLLESGVRQGGILSPLLFTVYVDSILHSLSMSNLGCYINFVCHNSFMYADDLLLLSPSVTRLQELFHFCEQKFSALDLPINVNKCQCIRIGSRYKTNCAKIVGQGKEIDWVDKIRYLGVDIVQGSKFVLCFSEAKRKFFYTANTILGNLGNRSPVVLLHLIMAQALRHLTYGLTAVVLSKAEINNLSFAYNSVFSKVFKITEANSIAHCQYFQVT